MEYVLKRGTTFRVLLRDLDGVAGEVQSVRASLVPALSAKTRPDIESDDPSADFAVLDYVPANGADAGYWPMELSPEQTDPLALRDYLIDARIIFDTGEEDVTDPARVKVVAPATARAA